MGTGPDRGDDATEGPGDGMGDVLARNVGTPAERRQREEAEATTQESLAATTTRFTGGMAFVHLPVAAFRRDVGHDAARRDRSDTGARRR